MTPEHKAYLRAASRLKSAEAAEAATLKAFQESCSHAVVYETPMRDGWMTTHAPMRVCARCGWAEEGWNCGYGLLNVRGNVPEIDIDRFHKLRRGPVHQWKPGQPHRNDGSK